jgi:uncharacterized protein (UPF0335 family)
MSGNNDAGGTGDAEFDAFASVGHVEGSFDGIGDEAKAGDKADDKADDKPKRRGPPREAPKQEAAKTPAGEGDDDADKGEKGEEDDDDKGEEDDDDKPKKTARDHQIERLKREKSDLNKRLRALEGGAGTAALQAQITALESRLTGGKGGDTKTVGTTAPDPSDTEKYPLGHLDDRYIEDKLDWLAEQKATKLADSALQRQQESEQTRVAEAAQAELLEKVDTLAEKGSEISEDFQEVVVEAGMRGDWKLTQTTFEAAHDAENGAQILYDLANNPKEAARVAKLPPIQQLRYVLDKDTELGAGKGKARTKPQAGDPPKSQSKGANSTTKINPATDNLDDFETAWERDAKGTK